MMERGFKRGGRSMTRGDRECFPQEESRKWNATVLFEKPFQGIKE